VNGVFVDMETDVINGPHARELFGQVFYFQQNSTHGFAPLFYRFKGRKPWLASSRMKKNYAFIL
jgi:hypothetical protein